MAETSKELALELLDAVYDALVCTPLGAPDDKFLYHGPTPADCCSSVSTWIDSGDPMVDFPNTFSGSLAEACDSIARMVRIGVRVWRNCWPVDGDGFPSAADMGAAAADLADDFDAIWCAVRGLYSCDDPTCPNVSYGRLTPNTPLGGCAGWTMYVTVDGTKLCCPEPCVS